MDDNSGDDYQDLFDLRDMIIWSSFTEEECVSQHDLLQSYGDGD